MKKLFFIFLLLAQLNAFSQTESSIVEFKNASAVSTPKGYSHAAIVDLGICKMIILSGQVPLDSKGNLVGKDDVAKQTQQVFLNIQSIVADLGGTMDNVIKLNIFMLDAQQIQAVRDVRNQFINLKNPPASTLVEVRRLFREDVLIEIEATAIIPKK